MYWFLLFFGTQNERWLKAFFNEIFASLLATLLFQANTLNDILQIFYLALQQLILNLETLHSNLIVGFRFLKSFQKILEIKINWTTKKKSFFLLLSLISRSWQLYLYWSIFSISFWYTFRRFSKSVLFFSFICIRSDSFSFNVFIEEEEEN